MSPYALLANLAGLSLREAAEFHGVAHATITSWSSGRRRCPPGALDELRGLIRKQEKYAEHTLDVIRTVLIQESERDQVTLGYPADDHEAASMGWPSVGAWSAVAARVMVHSPVPVVLVPRGATLETAGAADIRELKVQPR